MSLLRSTQVFLLLLGTSFIKFSDGSSCGGLLTLRSGVIKSPNFPSSYGSYLDCVWRIQGPSESTRININFSEIKLEGPREGSNACYDYIRVTSVVDGDDLRGYHGFFCGSYTDQSRTSNTRTMLVTFHTDSSITSKGFHATFNMTNFVTTTTTTTTMRPCTADEIVCPSGHCIANESMCNGVNDCGDYWDENCWQAPWNVTNATSYVSRMREYLYQQENSNYGGWGDFTPQAIGALHLASPQRDEFGLNTSMKNLLRVKQLDVELFTNLIRNVSGVQIKPERLALYIMALLVTCKDPQDFYGQNLAAKLIEVDHLSPQNFNPLVSLALCLADLDFPDEHQEELAEYLERSTQLTFFYLDMKALAVLAVQCAQRRGQTLDSKLVQDAATALDDFASLQEGDGSFGSLTTSALVGQALLAAQETNRKPRWDFFKLVQFIERSWDSTENTDIGTVFLVIPALTGRSLLDLGESSCPARPRMRRHPTIGANSTIHVTYSLWLGDDKSSTYTVNLNFPGTFNVSFFDLLKRAAHDNPKFSAQWRMFESGPVIFSINNVINRPQDQTYWRLFRLENGRIPKRIKQRMDEVFPRDREHYVMWFTSHIQ